MKRQLFFERECVHREVGVDGDVYNGMFYIQALQRLQSDEAVKIAGKVSPFYWVDTEGFGVALSRMRHGTRDNGITPSRCPGSATLADLKPNRQ